MENNFVLRGALFGGFNRNDVLRCVDALKSQVAKEKDLSKVYKEKADKLPEVERKMNEYCSALTQSQSENESLKESNKDLSQKLSALNNSFTQLQDDLAVALERASGSNSNRYDQLMRALTRCENENKALRQQLKEAEGKLEIARNSEKIKELPIG